MRCCGRCMARTISKRASWLSHFLGQHRGCSLVQQRLHVVEPVCVAGYGAGDGNRTRVSSLGSWRSTIELRPQRPKTLDSLAHYIGVVRTQQISVMLGDSPIFHRADGTRSLLKDQMKRIHPASYRWQPDHDAGGNQERHSNPRHPIEGYSCASDCDSADGTPAHPPAA